MQSFGAKLVLFASAQIKQAWEFAAITASMRTKYAELL